MPVEPGEGRLHRAVQRVANREDVEIGTAKLAHPVAAASIP